MNKLTLYILSLLLILNACSLSNDVNNGRFVQKRKYNKGFYIKAKSKKNRIIKSSKKFKSNTVIDLSSEPTIKLDKMLENPPQVFVNEAYEKELNRPIGDGQNKKIRTKPIVIEQSQIISSLEKEIQVENIPAEFPSGTTEIPYGVDILIYLFLGIFTIPLIVGTIYLAIRRCSLGSVLLNLLLASLTYVSVFLLALSIFTGLGGGILFFLLLSIGLMIGTYIQGIHALEKRSGTNPAEGQDFYIVD